VDLKPGFHYRSWRPELTAQIDGWPVSITCQHGPSTRLVKTGLKSLQINRSYTRSIHSIALPLNSKTVNMVIICDFGGTVSSPHYHQPSHAVNPRYRIYRSIWQLRLQCTLACRPVNPLSCLQTSCIRCYSVDRTTASCTVHTIVHTRLITSRLVVIICEK